MDQHSFKKYLKDRYEKQVKWYSQKSSENKKWCLGLNTYTIVVSIVVPIATLTLDTSQLIIKFLIAVLSSTVAIATGVNSLLKFHDNWINYRTTSETLKKEKSFYQGGVGEYAQSSDKEALFIERVESIISRENSLWLTTQQVEKNRKKD